MTVSDSASPLSSILTALLFLFGLAVTALPIVLPAHLPTQDGGAHYNTAMVMAGLESNSTFFGRYFEVRAGEPSNQLASLMITGAAKLGFAQNAERVIWVIIFAAFSALTVINVSIIGKEKLPFCLLLLPLYAGALVDLGFINYLVGLLLFVQGAFLLRVGLRRPSIQWLTGMLALSVATYVVHPISAFTLAATAGSLAFGYLIWWTLGLWRQTAKFPFTILFPIGCALPCAVVAALAVHDAWPQIITLFANAPRDTSSVGSTLPLVPAPDTLRERLIFVFGLSYFVNYSPRDYLFSLGFALTIGGLCVVRLARVFQHHSVWRLEDVWLVPAATLLMLAIAMPRRFEYFMPERIIPCLLVVILMWLAELELGHRARRLLLVIGLLLNVGLLVSRLQWASSIDAVLEEYASIGPIIPNDTSVLSVSTAPTHLQMYCRAVRPRRLPCNFRPTLHFIGELIGDRPIALLTNYQLRPEAGYFPVSLRGPWLAYTESIEDLQRWPPLPAYSREVVEKVARLIVLQPPDVIVTWDEQLATGGSAALDPETMRPLVQQYTKVFTSQPLGAASVYIKNNIYQ